MDPVDGVQPSVLLEFVPGMTGMRPPKQPEYITSYIPVWVHSKGNLVSIKKTLHLSKKPMGRAATSFTPTINPFKSVVGLPGLLKIPFKAVRLPQKASTARPATAPGSLGLSAVGPAMSVSLNHSICYTAIHFDSSFGLPRTLIGDIKKVCLLLKMGNMPGSKKTKIFLFTLP
jgi:hypothetical protein